MNTIAITNVNGVPPYTISVCDIYQIDCIVVVTGQTAIPPAICIDVPPKFQYAPELIVKITDSTGCVFIEIFSVVTPTPTVSITPTFTPTASFTPTMMTPTPTPSITSSPPPAPSQTPTLSQTPTITLTPSPTRQRQPAAYLFIEPFSGSSNIGQWMYDRGLSFYGFTNGTQPTMNQTTFNDELNGYVDFSGWTSGDFPRIFTSNVPQTSGGVDSYGNPIVAYNFETMIVPSNTVESDGWYTWIIPTGLTIGLIQKEIDVSMDNPNVLVSTFTEPKIYTYTFDYTGNTIFRTTYRVYTTFPSSNFKLSNITNIYFRGSVVGS